MSIKNYIINRSNYTVKTKRQNIRNGSVYERDFMTTTSPGSWEGDVFTYNESNFKMQGRRVSNSSRKHLYGDWLQGGCGDSETTSSNVWTLSCMGASTGSTESKIILKPNYGNISDFAYFGSLEDLIRSTVNYVNINFPAELYITDTDYEYWDAGKQKAHVLGYNLLDEIDRIKDIEVNGVKIYEHAFDSIQNSLNMYAELNMVLISNPYEIDITTKSLNTLNKSNINLLRYFCESVRKYSIVLADDEDNVSFEACPCDWEVLYKGVGCFDGQLTAVIKINDNFHTSGSSLSQFVIFEFYTDGQYFLLTDKSYKYHSIRPYNIDDDMMYITAFENGMDDFTYLLLNRTTTPKYTCTVDYPYETEKGLRTHKRSLTWPTLYGYNIDTVTAAYNSYLDTLLDLANFYDNGYTNNLWNRMTHDSIKSMDKTFMKADSTDNNEDYDVGIARMESLIHLYGRFFDDLKRHIDNIRYTNSITYNEYNNLPDYFLSDSLSLAGWEVSSAVYGLGGYNHKIGNKIYTANDANTIFLRNLKLNSKDIFTRKGTKAAIEMVLGLFGLRSYDFARLNYYNLPDILHTKQGHPTFDDTMYDYQIDEHVAVVTGGGEIHYGDDEMDVEKYNRYKSNYDPEGDTLQGLPCTIVKYEVEDGVSGETQSVRYIVPWFTDVSELDGHPYFQMYGGWGRMADKSVNGKIIYEYDGHRLYDETLKYLMVVRTIGDLSEIPLDRLHNGDVCYVYDTTDYANYFGEEIEESEDSHMFYIQDVDNSGDYGDDGWVLVPQSDIDNGVGIGMRVLYLESIIDSAKGNDPHVGYGKYDDGDEYLDYFRHLFKYAIENDVLSDDATECDGSGIKNEIKDCGFEITKQKDNMKTWFFHDTHKSDSWFITDNISGDTKADTWPDVGKNAMKPNSATTTYESELEPYSFEGKEANEESSSLSVINTKTIDIIFNCKNNNWCGNDNFKDYFYNSINPYLKQVIPSTVIYNVQFLGKDGATYTSMRHAPAVGTTNDPALNAYRNSK